jgi:hypothetical protein
MSGKIAMRHMIMASGAVLLSLNRAARAAVAEAVRVERDRCNAERLGFYMGTAVIDGYISGFGCALRDVDLVINERKYRRKALFVLVIALLLLALLIGMAY